MKVDLNQTAIDKTVKHKIKILFIITSLGSGGA
ncbi:MAG: hypothetical protein RLZZ74_3752, partial [Cyanobacteriota bacterium]